MRQILIPAFALLAWLPYAAAQTTFVNFESPQVHPLEVVTVASGATWLLQTNTPDNRLEVYAADAAGLHKVGSIGVGLEPISVRARGNSEAWVVNHLSDSVTVIDLATLKVKATLLTGDEPADVVFAGSPQRAFVSVSQRNRIEVFNPALLSAAPTTVAIAGEEPRALATDGTRVWCAIFEAGNDTTAIPETVVASSVNPYPGDPNPPPNSGTAFNPPIAADLPSAPDSSIIVRKAANGTWRDINDKDWSAAVTWGLHGNDIAQIDANSLAVTYKKGFLTANMALASRADGSAVVVGTEAKNEIRFESNVKGIFTRVEGATFSSASSTPILRRDLNQHLSYATASIPMAQRELSLGDPRGVAYSSDGARVFVTGMGSDNLAVFDAATMNRSGLVSVGEGPTGVVSDAANNRIYVLNRFESTISVLDQQTLAEVERESFFDPTPTVVRVGRPFLFDTHIASGLGQASCGSCHIDGRLDRLSWDLGDPQGVMVDNQESCNLGLPVGTCEDFHPMKGPMNTQTLVGLGGLEPFHWRGDRADLSQFAHATVSLLGGDSPFTTKEMTRLQAYLASIAFPPNPNRILNGTMPSIIDLGSGGGGSGNPNTGFTLYTTGNLDFVQCSDCHTLPTGGQGTIISASLLQEAQSMKVPQLRNIYEKSGMDKTSQSNNSGFGFVHDGATDTLFKFFSLSVFNFASGAAGNQQRRDVAAFMMCFDTGTHASVGAQATMGGAGSDQTARRATLLTIAQAGSAQLVARGNYAGEPRSFLLTSGTAMQSDRLSEVRTIAQLDAQATAASPFLYTLVPNGTGARTALDRDGDGFYDRDELDQCADPANPSSVPSGGSGCPDLDSDGLVAGSDLAVLLSHWGSTGAGDLDCSGVVDGSDLATLLGGWGICP
ncbi:MAG: hypothetical protein EXS00_01360 [Phycisphaerales bacterium]|nr:hypothetical protein [Phycisphaerales bacterium]